MKHSARRRSGLLLRKVMRPSIGEGPSSEEKKL